MADSRTDLAVRVIPCLDVDAGRVVKGVNFANLRDAGDPVELAAAYDAEGADELTFLDVTASSSGRATMLDVVRRTAEQVFIPLTVGGGVRAVADVDALLRAGADKVSVNTDENGVRRMSVSYIRKVVPKAKVKAEKLPEGFSNLSEADQTAYLTLKAKMQVTAIDIAS